MFWLKSVCKKRCNRWNHGFPHFSNMPRENILPKQLCKAGNHSWLSLVWLNRHQNRWTVFIFTNTKKCSWGRTSLYHSCCSKWKQNLLFWGHGTPPDLGSLSSYIMSPSITDPTWPHFEFILQHNTFRYMVVGWKLFPWQNCYFYKCVE